MVKSPSFTKKPFLPIKKDIDARKKKLKHAREKVQESSITTKPERRRKRKERVNDLKTTKVIKVLNEVEGEKRDIIADLVDTDITNADHRTLTAILYASTQEQVTEITANNKVVIFDLEDDTHIEATKMGDCITLQGRAPHKDTEIAVSFPETCLQENEVLETIQNLLDKENGWAA